MRPDRDWRRHMMSPIVWTRTGTGLNEGREPMSESFKLPSGLDPFGTSQQLGARFLRAAMRCRHEQRRIVERAAELYDLPTRSEVDALARRLHALERENRALKRRVEAGARRRRSKA